MGYDANDVFYLPLGKKNAEPLPIFDRWDARYNFVGNDGRTLFARAEPDIDLTGYETEQVFFESKDGTRIPMFIRVETRAGHGSGKPTWMRIEGIADQWAFLVRALEMEL
jgi:prolyl oligopeptidase PreP (S9A serine peptidase family)